MKLKIDKQRTVRYTVITASDDGEISIDFNPKGNWQNYTDQFKRVTTYLQQKENISNIMSCEIAFKYGYVVDIMFKKYKSLKLEETWEIWFRRFIKAENVKMAARSERYYRQFYALVKEYPKIKLCGTPFYKLKDKISSIKKAITLHPEYTKYLK